MRMKCVRGRRCGDARCGRCRLIKSDPAFDAALREVRAAPKPVAVQRLPDPPCPHLGPATGKAVGCRSCGGLTPIETRRCGVFGLTVLGNLAPASDEVKACRWCDWNPHNRRKDLVPWAGPAKTLLPADRITQVGPAGLEKGVSGWAFNPGLARFKGRLLMAYRTDWTGSRVHVAELSEDYRVLSSTRLKLDHPVAPVGQEDPRLFVAGDELRLHFIGVQEGRTSQLHARLNDDLTVRSVHYPSLANRQEPKEKNWSPFWHDGRHLAVYQPGQPDHVVVAIDGDRAERIASTPVPFPWSGGYVRGGAQPVRVGGLYYHWFHGRVGPDSSPWYSIGLSVFEAKFPFRVVAMSPDPFMWGDLERNLIEDKSYACTAFVGGAVLEDRRWKIAYGRNDRAIEIAEWDFDAVNRVMGLGTFRPRPGTNDQWVYDEVVSQDTYRLADLDVAGQVLVDVGAHVGTFALAAAARGAAGVHCYEPDAVNYTELLRHTAGMGGVVAVNAGVTRDTVRAVVRRAAAAAPAGRVRLLKIDCEGCEWDVLAGLGDAARLVDMIVGEWHPPKGAADVAAILSPYGFRVVGRDTGAGLGIFTARREKP